MDNDGLYDAHARERLVAEPPKRVEAPERTAFERDRARVVHAAAFRRLAAKTQVVGPETDDFVRNRLTHSLEVAQVARDLSRALGSQPDIAETAALAHDLGHPPFGHNGERALAQLSEPCGGFEGNAQTLRLLTRLEAKTVDADGRSVGLNLTRATLDACCKYPWTRDRRHAGKFGVYDDDLPVFDWLRAGSPSGPPVPRGADHGPRRRRGLLRARRRGRRRRRRARAHRDGPRRGLVDRPRVVPAERLRRRARGRPGRAADPGQLADGGLRRQPRVAGCAQEPHQRPDRPLLRSRPGGHVRRRRQGRSSATRRTWSSPTGPASRSRCSRASRPTTS